MLQLFEMTFSPDGRRGVYKRIIDRNSRTRLPRSETGDRFFMPTEHAPPDRCTRLWCLLEKEKIMLRTLVVGAERG